MNRIFNNEEIDVFGMIEYIKNELNGVVPFIQVQKGSLGIDNVMLLVSFDPKEKWNYGYVENSNYFRMIVESNGIMEVFTQSLYVKKIISYETRLKIKFRKCTVKDKETVVRKIKEFIGKVKIELGE